MPCSAPTTPSAAALCRWTAGETSKTFDLLITEDQYVEGAEQFSVTLSNLTGATLGNQSVATVTINDDDTAQTLSPAANPIDDSAIFVGQTYHDFLSRQADSGGQAYWTSTITSCGSDLLCINARRIRGVKRFLLRAGVSTDGRLCLPSLSRRVWE